MGEDDFRRFAAQYIDIWNNKGLVSSPDVTATDKRTRQVSLSRVHHGHQGGDNIGVEERKTLSPRDGDGNERSIRHRAHLKTFHVFSVAANVTCFRREIWVLAEETMAPGTTKHTLKVGNRGLALTTGPIVTGALSR